MDLAVSPTSPTISVGLSLEMHYKPFRGALAASVMLAGFTSTAVAQDRGTPLEAGTVAPDFELVGSTRYGVLEEPVRLSDFRGKTVVLAFFFRARTPG